MYDNLREKHHEIPVQDLNDRCVAAQDVVDEAHADDHPPLTAGTEIHKDGQGFPSQSVRFCDLDLIKDK